MIGNLEGLHWILVFGYASLKLVETWAFPISIITGGLWPYYCQEGSWKKPQKLIVSNQVAISMVEVVV